MVVQVSPTNPTPQDIQAVVAAALRGCTPQDIQGMRKWAGTLSDEGALSHVELYYFGGIPAFLRDHNERAS